MVAPSKFVRTLEQFSSVGTMDSPSPHVGMEQVETGYVYHCGLCRWELKHEWNDGGTDREPKREGADGDNRDRVLLELYQRQILHLLDHAPADRGIFVDEVEGEGSAVGRAFAALVCKRLIMPGNEWRASRKAHIKSRKVRNYLKRSEGGEGYGEVQERQV